MANSPGPLGWIPPADRTPNQEVAHHAALARIPKYAAPPMADPPKGFKLILTELWGHPKVVRDVGEIFTGFHQLTGSCVGVSEGDAVFTLGCVQRVFAPKPTRAFVPWWAFPYGRTRANEGDRGQGEGAVDSVMGDTLEKEGVFDVNQQGLPTFKKDDGWYLTEKIEYQWSDGNSSLVTGWKPTAAPNTLQHASLSSSREVRDSILQMRPVLYGCSKFIGNGSIRGSGANSYARGVYDGNGGHSTCFLGYYNHPDDGPLYLYSNQWPTGTYPKDPAGGGRCCVWTPESEVDKMFSRYGGGGGETMSLQNLLFTPAIEDVMTWADM